MRLLSLIFASIIGLSTTAHAGILLEPYLGYGMTTTKDNLSAGAKSKINAPAVGARIGGEFAMIFVAADASTTIGAKVKPDSGGASFDATSTDVYAVVGANLPIVRLWAGYGLLNEVKAKTTPETKFYGGSHFKLGVGFSVIPMLSLNAEYFMGNYTKGEAGGIKGTSDIDSNTIFVSVSAPFSF